MKEKHNNSKGFTLIETMTAMIILAISLTTILQLFSGGLKSARLSDEYTHAIFHAKEKMEEILLSDKLADSEYDGKFEDGFKWAVRISLLQAEDDEQIKKSDTYLFNINVSVSWNDGSRVRKFEISTIHIAEKNQDIS